MTEISRPTAIIAEQAPSKRSIYPEPFASRMSGREKKPLGDLFHLTNFGVNLTSLAPGAQSSLRHSHLTQDEFIYIIQGSPSLITNIGETQLQAGMCAGFKAGTGDNHQLVNRSGERVVYLEIGDRTAGDFATYPDDDIEAVLVNGHWQFNHKDGTPY